MQNMKQRLNITFVMIGIAFIALCTATYAWFTVSMSANVKTMELEVTTGMTLKLNPDDTTWNDETAYKSTVEYITGTGGDFATQFNTVYTAVDYPETLKLSPLTSGNGRSLYTEGGNTGGASAVPATDKRYCEFYLFFMAAQDCHVHLVRADSASATAAGTPDGTAVTASNGSTELDRVTEGVRISFTPYEESAKDPTTIINNKTFIYQPDMANGSAALLGQAATDAGAASQETFTLDGTNDFSTDTDILELTGGQPRKVVVRIWIEGQDIVDNQDHFQGAKFQFRFRFVGTDAAGNPFD